MKTVAVPGNVRLQHGLLGKSRAAELVSMLISSYPQAVEITELERDQLPSMSAIKDHFGRRMNYEPLSGLNGLNTRLLYDVDRLVWWIHSTATKTPLA